jgi:phospholipid-binding lipoprotein MlaA
MIAMLKNKVFPTLIIGLSLTVLAPTTVSAAEDPFEPLNRRIFEFNEGADAILLKPVAEVYDSIIPAPMRQGFENIYDNLSDVNGALNATLQGRPQRAVNNSGRVLLNTTIGIFGLFDVASHMGIERYETDFGHTMARWGVPEGPYVMVPFLGPRTMRSGFGDGIDSFISAQDALFEDEVTWGARGWSSLEFRAQLLEAEELITGDRYVFIRDAYLQSREALVNDGVVVDSFSDFEDDDWDEDF